MILNGLQQILRSCDLHRNKFLYNKTNRRTIFPNFFWIKMNFYMFRVVPLPVIRSSLTVHLALVYVIRFEDSFRGGPGPDDRQRNCPKHVEIHF